MKAAFLFSLVLSGGAASNLLAWSAAIPGFMPFVIAAYLILALTIIWAVIAENALCETLQLSINLFRSWVAGFTGLALFALIARLCTNLPPIPPLT
jgi:hypothetical protein